MKEKIYQTVFVDCFNTIVLRTTSAKDVLFAWSSALGERYDHHPAYFYYAFLSAQRTLSSRGFFRNGEAEFTFREISDRICRQLGDVDATHFYEEALSLYIEAEQSFHAPNEALCQKLSALKKQGCKLYLLSDFYCGKAVVYKFLQNAGIDFFDDIFVSCDFGCSKRSGTLYRHALKQTGAKRSQTLMIGDNRFSDRLMARLNGLHAEDPLTRPPVMSETLKNELKKSTCERKYDEIFSAHGNKYNYSNYAFTLYLFTKRLFERFSASGSKHLFFCSREGQFMKKLFDAYCAYHGHEVDTRYLYISRNSVAALRPLEEENFEYVQQTYPIASTSCFLKSISFSKEQIEEVLTHLKKDPDRRKLGYYHSKTYRTLLDDEVFRRIYGENQRRNVAAFTKYMESFGVDFRQDGLVLVDVGWRGGVQYYLERFYGESVKIHGYYIGLSKANPTKEGLLWTKAKEKRTGNTLFHHRILDYEQILRADHNRVAGYKLDGDGAKVVFGTELDHHKLYEEFIRPMQEQIYENFLRIMEVDREHAGFSYTACKYFHKMMVHISKEDVAWLQLCEDTHYDYFGNIGVVFKRFGHTLVRLYHGAQNFWFRIKARIVLPHRYKKKML